MDVEGKIALVTGSAEGLGRAFAEALLKKGAMGVSIVDVNHELGEETAQYFASKYGSSKAVFIHCDVTSEQQLEDAFRKTKETYGRLDIVCNNAGIADEEAWRKMIDTNLTAVINGTNLARQYMSKKFNGSGGVVINTASICGLFLAPMVPVYNAVKHGIVAFTRTLAKSDPAFTAEDVRLNVLCPMVVDTNMARHKFKAAYYFDAGEDRESALTQPFLQVAEVATAFMRLVENDHHGKVMRVTLEKGIDFHEFPTPFVPTLE